MSNALLMPFTSNREILQEPQFLTLDVISLALISPIVEWFPVDITALMVLAVLMLFGLVTPDKGLSGFSNSATVSNVDVHP